MTKRREALVEWQLKLEDDADGLVLLVYDWAEERQVDPVYAMQVVGTAFARFCGRIFGHLVDELSPEKVSEIIAEELESFPLSARKELIRAMPERLTEQFRRDTARLDREVKRRRGLGEPGGEG
jgi:hypothetical protein